MGQESSAYGQISAAGLERWLLAGDPAADGVVVVMRERQLPLREPLAAIRGLAAACEPCCRQLLDDMEAVPDWADFAAMQKGGAMAYRLFPQLAIALVHGGLMMSFAAPESARILAGSYRLEQGVARRLFESATLFFGVLDTEALRPGGAVWEVCLKVRLMHSMVRLRLLAAGDWNPQDGKPVNPLHISAGPLFFGSMVLRSMGRLGARVSEDEAVGYRLIWRYVTYLLGVPQALLGRSDAEQEAINAQVESLAFNPNEHSRRLAQVLMAGLGDMPQVGRLPRAVHEALSRRLLGDELANGMGLPRRAWAERAVEAMVLGFRAYGASLRLPPLARRAEAFGQRYMRDFLVAGLAGRAADFQEHPR